MHLLEFAFQPQDVVNALNSANEWSPPPPLAKSNQYEARPMKQEGNPCEGWAGKDAGRKVSTFPITARPSRFPMHSAITLNGCLKICVRPKCIAAEHAVTTLRCGHQHPQNGDYFNPPCLYLWFEPTFTADSPKKALNQSDNGKYEAEAALS